MKGKSALAVAVCLACFFIGYLAYRATVLIVDGVLSTVELCEKDGLCGPRNAESAK